jgi:hypothetical protein
MLAQGQPRQLADCMPGLPLAPDAQRKGSTMVSYDDSHIPLERRMEIFQAVVEAQDQGFSSVRARQQVAKQFAVSETAVQRIEEEGLQGEWPPL